MAEQKGSQKGVVALWLLFCAHGLPIPKYGVDEPWGEEKNAVEHALNLFGLETGEKR